MTMDCKTGSPCPHVPTEITRAVVSNLYAVGIKQDAIAKRLDISDETLRKYYRKELDEGLQDLHAEMVNLLIKKARDGNLKAVIFWLTCRAGWYAAQAPREPEVIQELPFVQNAKLYELTKEKQNDNGL